MNDLKGQPAELRATVTDGLPITPTGQLCVVFS